MVDFTSITALIISIIALVYTIKTFLLKSGINIRGSYTICSSIACNDKYIGNITLENLKDKAVIIFKVYLKLGHNYFLEIINFENAPLILKPFEIFCQEFDPIDLYSIGSTRIILDNCFTDKRVKRQLILSTSTGKYIINSYIALWDPTIDFFKNHFTGLIYPMRSHYKNKAYGANAKYIVEIKMSNEKEEIIPIYSCSTRFEKFGFTKDSLANKKSLEEFLYDKVGEGLLNCTDIVVFDYADWYKKTYKPKESGMFKAKYYNWFMYHVVGPIYTACSYYRLKKKNKMSNKK